MISVIQYWKARPATGSGTVGVVGPSARTSSKGKGADVGVAGTPVGCDPGGVAPGVAGPPPVCPEPDEPVEPVGDGLPTPGVAPAVGVRLNVTCGPALVGL